MKFYFLSVSAFLILAMYSFSGFCAVLDLSASQDTYASNTSSDSDVNYGNSSGLGLARNPLNDNWAQRIFLQFDLSGLPSDAKVQMAELSLYMGYHDQAVATQTHVRRVTSPWLQGKGGTKAQSVPGERASWQDENG